MDLVAPSPRIPLASAPASASPAAIALGSNLPSAWGSPLETLGAALTLLGQSPGIWLTGLSSFYQTAPIGPPQPDYCNACATLVTTYDPEDLLMTLHRIEAQFGRQRQTHWGPRTLDLDLLLYGDVILESATLQLPHPHLGERDFVLVPLAEIAAHWIDPRSGRSIQAILKALNYRRKEEI